MNAALERASAQLHDIRAVVDTNSRQIAGMLALPRRESLVRLPSPRGVVCATRDKKLTRGYIRGAVANRRDLSTTVSVAHTVSRLSW
jgi:hypothetical protein